MEINAVTLSGTTTRDCEFFKNAAGAIIGLKFGLAVNRSWFDSNTEERVEEVSFFDCVLYKRGGSVALLNMVMAKMTKGSKDVTITGRLKQDRWVDPATNSNRAAIHVVCENIVGPWFYKPNGGSPQPDPIQVEQTTAANIAAVTELPDPEADAAALATAQSA